MQRFRSAPALILVSAVMVRLLSAQSENTPIFEQGAGNSKEEQQRVTHEIERLRKSEPLINKEEIDRQVLAPNPQPVELLPPHAHEMSTEDVADSARKGNLRVGYCYKCPSCDNWHLNLAGGYAIAPDVIVTCDHVVNTRMKMKTGYLIAVDQEGNVAGAVAVLARNAAMDVAIVRVAGAKFSPVPLNRNARQGASSFCFSIPLRQEGYFSDGIINRFYWNQSYKDEDKDSIEALRHLRVDFSNDWAPGSSGSPLFDKAGNVLGHVSTIAGLGGGKSKGPFLTIHTGIPARSVERLVQAMHNPEEIRRIAALDASGPESADNPEAKKPSKAPSDEPDKDQGDEDR